MSVAMPPPSRTSSSYASAYAQEEEAPQQMHNAPSLNPDNLEPLGYNNDDDNGVFENFDVSLIQHLLEDDNTNSPPSCLLIESDTTFLDPLQNFLRTQCIEIFVATQHHIDAPGRGSRPSCIGQLGLRCIHCKDMSRKELARQAICYPSTRDTIFEAVRNYQRTHLKVCPLIPQVIMDEYNKVSSTVALRQRSKQVLKVYYAVAASELGIIDSSTHKGLLYDKSRVNTSGMPSQRLQTIIEAAESPSKFASLFTASGRRISTSLDSNNGPTIDSKLEMRKFEHVCSESTRKVLLAARKEPTVFVAPQDFPTVSDEHYLLYHQFGAVRVQVQSTQQEEQDVYKCGLCCKHCAFVTKNMDIVHRGVYYPGDHKSLVSRKLSLLFL